MKIKKLLINTVIVGVFVSAIPITNAYSQTNESINKGVTTFEDVEVAKVDDANKIMLNQESTSQEIQDAIDKMSKLGGGAVILSKGTYVLDNSIILRSNVILQGSGKGQTILKREANYRIEDGKGLLYSKGGLTNVIVKNLTIDVNYDTMIYPEGSRDLYYGVLINDYNGKENNLLHFDEIELKNASMGFHIKGTRNLLVSSSDFHDNGGDYYYYHNAYIRRVYKGRFENCNFYNSPSGNGLNISYCEDIIVNNSKAYNNYFRGIRAATSDRVVVSNSKAFENKVGDGIVMNSEDKGVSDFVIKNNEVYGNGGYGISISGICKNGYIVNNIDGGDNTSGFLLNRGKNIVEINTNR